MRYQNFVAFQKHLASAAPDHLARCYLVAIPDEYERSIGIDAILTYFRDKPLTVLNGAEVNFKDISDALLSPSLFGGDPIVVIHDAEKMAKKEQEALSLSLSHLYGYLICSVKSKTALISSIEKAGVVLDCLDEKSWDKDKRRSAVACERAQKAGKRIAPDAIMLLLERIGSDPALLKAEVDKLICYVGTKPTIERADVFRISAESHTAAIWKIAEDLVWEGHNPTLDPSMFHPLMPVIRNQLQMGLKIVDLAAANTSKEKWATYMPKVWPKLLEKRMVQAAKLGRSYFQSGLNLIFDVELLARSGTPNEAALLDLFRYSLHYGRR